MSDQFERQEGSLHPVSVVSEAVEKSLTRMGIKEIPNLSAVLIGRLEHIRDTLSAPYFSSSEVDADLRALGVSSLRTLSYLDMVIAEHESLGASIGRWPVASEENGAQEINQLDYFIRSADVSMAAMVGGLKNLIRSGLGDSNSSDIQIAARKAPFLSPCAVGQIQCQFCHGEGCPVCGNRGRVSLGTAGIVGLGADSSPTVDTLLGSVSLNLDFIAMQRFGITSHRHLYGAGLLQ